MLRVITAWNKIISFPLHLLPTSLSCVAAFCLNNKKNHASYPCAFALTQHHALSDAPHQVTTIANITPDQKNASIKPGDILSFSGLSKSFGGHRVLDNINGSISPGEVILLRGDNGSGKTTLLNILTGCLAADSGTLEVHNAESHSAKFTFPLPFFSRGASFHPETLARMGIGRTWQDVRLFHSQTLVDNIAAADCDQADSPWSALFRPRPRLEKQLLHLASDRLRELGIPDREHSRADRISLGQSKRVAIARALQAGARILFLDEPLAGLDESGIHDVLTNLKELTTKQNTTLVIIEHAFHVPRILPLVTKLWTLKEGKLNEAPAGNEQKKIILAEQQGTNIHDLIRQNLHEQVEVSELDLPNGAKLTTYWRISRKEAEKLAPVLEVKNLSVERGNRTIIGNGDSKGFNLTLYPGEIAILQAPNGWGKSTLFEAISGNIFCKNGSIIFKGAPIQSSPAWTRSQQGLSASPSSAKLFPSLKVSDVARLAFRSPIDSYSAPNAQRTVSSLSGGEKQRTLLRFAFLDCKNRSIVLLDEPFAMLDKHKTREAISLISDIDCQSAVLILIPACQTKPSNHS